MFRLSIITLLQRPLVHEPHKHTAATYIKSYFQFTTMILVTQASEVPVAFCDAST